MHQDIIDALNLAGRRRGYDDGGMVADEMMSDDPTQQFMANLARAGFTQDQINSIIGSQSPQPNQIPSRDAKPIGGQPTDSRFYPGGSPNLPPPINGDPVNFGGSMSDNYGPGIDPYMGQPITEYAIPSGRFTTWGSNLGPNDRPIGMPPRQNVFYPGEGSGIVSNVPFGQGGQMTAEEWSRIYGPNVDPDPRMIRQDPSQGNLRGGLNTLMGGLGSIMGGGMGGGAPIQGAYGNPQYAPLGGGSKAGGPANPFAPNMPGGYGAPPSFYPPQGGNPYGGGAGHKGGGAGHKGGGGGYGGMF